MLFRHFYPHQIGFNTSSKSRLIGFLSHFPPGALQVSFHPFQTHSSSVNHGEYLERLVKRGAILSKGSAALWVQIITRASAGPCSKSPRISPSSLWNPFQVHQSDFLVNFLKIFSTSFYRHLEFMLLFDNLKKEKLNKPISNQMQEKEHQGHTVQEFTT